MPTYTYTPPDRDNLEANPETSQSEAKYRIYNIFKPTIVLDEISLPVSDTVEEKRTEDMVGLEYPLIKINNYFITPQEIDFVDIKCKDFLPKITLQITVTSDLFMDREMPKDGDIISLFIRNKSDVLNPIRNDYIINSVTPSKRRTAGSSPVTITFFGELFVPNLKGRSANTFKGTSMEVLKQVAEEMNLGFNTNDDNTDDRQLWYVTTNYEDFIHDVVERAWRDSNSFYSVWIDVYYNLNFVNIQKQLLSAEDDIDEAAVLNTVDSDWTWGTESDEEEMAPTPKVFSNYLGFRLSSFYITQWKPVNKSSALTQRFGLSMGNSFFEHLNQVYEEEEENYWELNMVPMYDQEKISNHILLRGRTTYDPSIHVGELARANHDYNEIYTQDRWMGVQYTLSNPNESNKQWTGNHHRNYMRAQVNNFINLIELDKLTLEVDVQGSNTNVIIGDKIPVVIVGTDSYENIKMDPNAVSSAKKNHFYSGWYLVKGFTLSWSKMDSVLSGFKQTFILTRREWPAPYEVDSVPNEI